MQLRMRPKIICVLVASGRGGCPWDFAPSLIPRLLNQVSCAERADMRGCELGKKRSRLHDRDEDVSRRLVLGTLLGLPAPRFLGEGRAWDQRAFLVRAVAPRASNAAASPSSVVVSVHLPPVALARLTRHHRIRPRVVDVFGLAVGALATATRTALGALTPFTLRVVVVFRVVVVGTLLVIASTRIAVVVAAPLLPRVFHRILRGGGGRLAPVSAPPRVERTRESRADRPLRARSRIRPVRVHGARRLGHRKVVVVPRRHRVGTRLVVMRWPADDLRHLLAPRRRLGSRVEPVAGIGGPVGPP
mmetsp:Transcript_9839/g.40325  ORF Transcript_9839/g.40325 Transcript_9839/m.40325 type:complete len:303 (-) Transcript_9839:1883-2791(-)